MKVVKAFAIVIVGLGAVAIVVWQFWLKGEVARAEVGAAYGAKMVCSCRFVAEREMTSCLTDFTADLGPVEFSEVNQSIEASIAGGIISATAVFEPGQGCTLVDLD